MNHPTAVLFPLTIGLDLGDRQSHAVAIDSNGHVTIRQRVPTTRPGLAKWFGPTGLTDGRPCRVVIEASTHSPWVCSELEKLGHEVVVANPRKMMRMGGRGRRKNDMLDAEELARIGRIDPKLLAPVRHRGDRARADLALIRVRNEVVAMRTSLVTCVRAHIKTSGHRLKTCSTATFHKQALNQIPAELHSALHPLLDLIKSTSEVIKHYDRQIDELATRQHRETQCLTQVAGVGNLTALTYILTLEDHRRFQRSRTAAAFLGLVPHQRQSGDVDPQLRISKTGDELLRKLLVTAAHHILGPLNKKDSDLRRFGERLTARGGAAAKKKAIVAVARKLATVLHALWRSGEVYRPLRNSPELQPAA